MPAENHIADITHTIQLSVAPVFLLTALGTTLSVLVTRLGRIVDRARRVEARLDSDDGSRATTATELQGLSHRAHLIHWALTAGTTAALLVCLLIAVAFLGSLVNVPTNSVLAVLFVLAMGAYVFSLVAFLREVIVASRAVELEHH